VGEEFLGDGEAVAATKLKHRDTDRGRGGQAGEKLVKVN
jgi:hypothetical protein